MGVLERLEAILMVGEGYRVLFAIMLLWCNEIKDTGSCPSSDSPKRQCQSCGVGVTGHLICSTDCLTPSVPLLTQGRLFRL